ncbi:peptidoglycan DD-metalloendopeptidase family protein [Arenimonas sp.]|uniref:peptidoglycan DD-metalloendopeptidase family protein n=1 Tax=Arenimonas sp. TaxID=1872635 RepID=UPI0039E5AB34
MGWCWPTQGQIIGRYVNGDPTQQGINIGGKAGQPVAAAGDGVAAYSGAGLVGYGELIIIKHSTDRSSADAHNCCRSSPRTKARPATIARTARMVVTPDLHFEIRRNGKPVDRCRPAGAPTCVVPEDGCATRVIDDTAQKVSTLVHGNAFEEVMRLLQAD